MERLTDKKEADAQRQAYEKRLKNGYPRNIPEERFLKLALYEDTGLEPEEIKEWIEAGKELFFERADLYAEFGTIDHIRELAQAEKDGRLIVWPCKVGDTVYEANKRGFVSTYKVISVHVSDCSVLIGWELIDGIYSNLNGFEVSELGKTVFLIRKEAEAALKKREEEDHEAD